MQSEIFERETLKSTAAGLIIVSGQKNMLSKQQQAFNKLVKKIERLRADLQQLSKTLNEKLDFYVKHISPLEQQLNELNKQLTKLLFGFFKNKKSLSKKERDSLGEVISAGLKNIFFLEKSEPDAELKEIFKAVEGISYEEAKEEEFRSLKSNLESILEEQGFDIDFDDMHSNMTEEDMIRKAMQMQEDLAQQVEEKGKKQAGRKKTKKQQEKEEKEKQIEEARTKNIGSIYRQLAKIFHPDLEQDEKLKLQKEELMKQLTIAYENNDLHTLLTLELAWVQKEENNTGNIADDKLGIYNEVLKEQVYELEEEINSTLQHPRYAPLQKFTNHPNEIKTINVAHEKQQVEEMKNELFRNITRLKGNEKQALAAVKELIREYEMESLFDTDFSEFFL